MAIRDELMTIKGNNEFLVAEEAVEWARKNKESALHGSLEWDDSVAGHQYRIWQVRRLIAIHVVNEERVRQVVSLSVDRTRPGGGYRMVDDVMPDKTLREVMLADALADLDRVHARHDRVTELASVWAEKDKVKAKIKSRARKVKAPSLQPNVS